MGRSALAIAVAHTMAMVLLLTGLTASGLHAQPQSQPQSQPEQFALPGYAGTLDDAGPTTEWLIPRSALGQRYDIVSGYAIAEGDIVLGKVDSAGRLPPRVQQRGFASDLLQRRWPDGILPYQFDASVSSAVRDSIETALQHWRDRTRITPLERTPENADDYPDHVVFEQSGGCASFVGRIGGPQTIWVAQLCPVGSIIHEIGHALGLYHEHTRPDRDNFVEVRWNNIVDGRDLNFDIIARDSASTPDYDYGSIMHYGTHFFSANGEPTIVAPDGLSIGQRDALSETDAAGINSLYATELALSVSPGESPEGVEFAVAVTNNGLMGAAELLIEAELPAGKEWLRVSNDAAWDCSSVLTRLSCRLDALAAGDVSRFTLTASSTTPADDASLTAILSSRTLDTDTLNNSVTLGATTSGGDGPEDTPDPLQVPEPTDPEPAAPANPAGEPDSPDMAGEPPLAAASDDAAAGPVNPLLLLILGGLAVMRRHHTPTVRQ